MATSSSAGPQKRPRAPALKQGRASQAVAPAHTDEVLSDASSSGPSKKCGRRQIKRGQEVLASEVVLEFLDRSVYARQEAPDRQRRIAGGIDGPLKREHRDNYCWVTRSAKKSGFWTRNHEDVYHGVDPKTLDHAHCDCTGQRPRMLYEVRCYAPPDWGSPSGGTDTLLEPHVYLVSEQVVKNLLGVARKSGATGDDADEPTMEMTRLMDRVKKESSNLDVLVSLLSDILDRGERTQSHNIQAIALAALGHGLRILADARPKSSPASWKSVMQFLADALRRPAIGSFWIDLRAPLKWIFYAANAFEAMKAATNRHTLLSALERSWNVAEQLGAGQPGAASAVSSILASQLTKEREECLMRVEEHEFGLADGIREVNQSQDVSATLRKAYLYTVLSTMKSLQPRDIEGSDALLSAIMDLANTSTIEDIRRKAGERARAWSCKVRPSALALALDRGDMSRAREVVCQSAPWAAPLLSTYGTAVDILRMRRLGGAAGEVRAEDLSDVDTQLENSFGDFRQAKAKQWVTQTSKDGGAARAVEELQQRVEKVRAELAVALEDEFVASLEGGDTNRAINLASGRWSLVYDILTLGKQWGKLREMLGDGRKAEDKQSQELNHMNQAMVTHMDQLFGYTGPLSQRALTHVRAEVGKWCAELRGTERQLQMRHQEKEERKQHMLDARKREVTERFLAVLTPQVHLPLPKDEDPAEAEFVAMQVPPEVRDRAREEAVFASDCRGCLLATRVIPGIDVPKDYNTPGFVPNFHYYCVLCQQPLDYWEQLPEHFENKKHQSWVQYLRECAEGTYEVYLEQNEKDYDEGVIVSSSRKAYSCEACGITSGPWWEVRDHKASWNHRDKAWKHKQKKTKEAQKVAAAKAKRDEKQHVQRLQEQQKLQEAHSSRASSKVRDKKQNFHEFLLDQCDA